MIHTGEPYQDSIRGRRVERDSGGREKDVVIRPRSVVDVPARIYDRQHEAETTGQMWSSYNDRDESKFLESQKRSRICR